MLAKSLFSVGKKDVKLHSRFSAGYQSYAVTKNSFSIWNNFLVLKIPTFLSSVLSAKGVSMRVGAVAVMFDGRTPFKIVIVTFWSTYLSAGWITKHRVYGPSGSLFRYSYCTQHRCTEYRSCITLIIPIKCNDGDCTSTKNRKSILSKRKPNIGLFLKKKIDFA